MGFKAKVDAPSAVFFSWLRIMTFKVNSDQAGAQTSCLWYGEQVCYHCATPTGTDLYNFTFAPFLSVQEDGPDGVFDGKPGIAKKLKGILKKPKRSKYHNLKLEDYHTS